MALTKPGREERNRIIAAFEFLGVPRETWSPLVGPEPVTVDQALYAGEAFRPPAFNSYEQTEEEWIALADEAWRKFRDDLVQRRRVWGQLGVDQVLKPKRRRGQGKTGRNARIEERYKCAALRLMGRPWKEIAAQYANDIDPIKGADSVRKTVTEILRSAQLDTRRK